MLASFSLNSAGSSVSYRVTCLALDGPLVAGCAVSFDLVSLQESSGVEPGYLCPPID